MKIISLQERMHSVDGDVSRTLMSSDNAVRTLSNELRFLKGSLAQLTEREQRVREIHSREFLMEFTCFLVTRFSSINCANVGFRCEDIICA